MNNQAKGSSGIPVCAHTIKLSTQWNCFPRQDGGWSIRKQTGHILQWKGLQVTLAQGHRHFVSQIKHLKWLIEEENHLMLGTGRSSGWVLRWFTFLRRWQEGEIGLCVHGWRRDYKKAQMLRARQRSITPNLGSWSPRMNTFNHLVPHCSGGWQHWGSSSNR